MSILVFLAQKHYTCRFQKFGQRLVNRVIVVQFICSTRWLFINSTIRTPYLMSKMKEIGQAKVYIKQYHRKPNSEGYGATRILYLPLDIVRCMRLQHKDLIGFFNCSDGVVIKKLNRSAHSWSCERASQFNDCKLRRPVAVITIYTSFGRTIN